MMLPDIAVRMRKPEVMDDPDLDGLAHRAALRGLERINVVSRSAGTIWRIIRTHAPSRVLDVATGAGDVPISLALRGQRAGLPITVAGCDASPRAIAFARARAEERRARVEWFTLDMLRDRIPAGYDVITASLFLHHLDDDDAVRVLGAMVDAAGQMIIVSDLERSAMGYLAASVGCRLLTRCPVVHTDGPRSVRAAFTIDEARRLAQRAGLAGAVITKCWPRRWLLTWSKP
ncbi:MAG: methyltransferase domain-containing protein [Phycisphaeraceae bacterium]|nr:methyltransferase domain-containing protein [Phycisphaeraceae bacterium]